MTKSELEAKLAEAVAQRDEAVEIANNGAEMAGILAAEAKERHDARVTKLSDTVSALTAKLTSVSTKLGKTIELLKAKDAEIDTLTAEPNSDYECVLSYLENRLCGHKIKSEGRKSQVL